MNNLTLLPQIFLKVAKLLEIKGENSFKIRAYITASEVLSEINIEEVLNNGKLKEVRGIGDKIYDKIIEFRETGTYKLLEQLDREFPESVMELFKVQGLGPKRVGILVKELGIKSIPELKRACELGVISTNLGQKLQDSLSESIEILTLTSKRHDWEEVNETVKWLSKELWNPNLMERFMPAGSFRRQKETVGDLDILIALKEYDKREEIMNLFTSLKNRKVLAKGETKSSIILESGLQVDLRVVNPANFGACLNYFTGSREHNIALRNIARSKGWLLNEYALYDSDNISIAGNTEEEIYEKLGFNFVPPKERIDGSELMRYKK